jgi:hypothetical protein
MICKPWRPAWGFLCGGGQSGAWTVTPLVTIGQSALHTKSPRSSTQGVDFPAFSWSTSIKNPLVISTPIEGVRQKELWFERMPNTHYVGLIPTFVSPATLTFANDALLP